MTPSQQTWLPLRYPDNVVVSHYPLDSEPDFSRLLGRLLERWSFVESELTVSMSHLLDGNPEAATAILYSINATSQRIGMVEAVARASMPDGPEKRGFLYLMEKISKLGKERNEYVHAEYHSSGTMGVIGRRLIRPSTATPDRWDEVTPKRLEAHILQVERRLLALEAINAEDVSYWTPRRSWL